MALTDCTRVSVGAARACLRTIGFGFLLLWPAVAHGRVLPDVEIEYEIEVTLDPASRELAGRETIRWRNPGAESVEALPLHMYLNAFSHDDTSWMRSAPRGFVDLDELLERHDDPWGWSELVSVRQDGIELDRYPISPDDGNPNDRSLVAVTLARAVAPGETVELEVDFQARLPIPIARTGGRDDYFVVAQWFPKIAAFEALGERGATVEGFNAHQFHGATEFYADFADFDVRMAVPADWAVAATGRGGLDPESSRADEGYDDGYRWHRYRQRAVHDFAWVTGGRMVDSVSIHQPVGGGGPVEIHVFVPRGVEHQVPRWLKAARGSLDVMGARVGPYPYETLTMVFGPWWSAATFGMEYPTLFTVGAGDPLWDLGFLDEVRINEVTVAHEFAHQYFQGLIASNEVEEAFLDEGFAEFWGYEIARETYPGAGGLSTLFGRRVTVSDIVAASLPHGAMPEPAWSGPSYLARSGRRFSQFYVVPSATMQTASAIFGRETVDAVFARYVERWAFRHPRFEDFLAVARETAGDDFADFVAEAMSEHAMPDYRAESLETEAWERPRGRVTTLDGAVDEFPLAGLDTAADEVDGRVSMEVLDPGWTSHERRSPGGIERRTVEPRWSPAESDWRADEAEYQVSTVRVEGPGWTHLPVEVRFRFADGAVVEETWDGRARYRLYRFVRKALLIEVRVDPGGKVALDSDPTNNALTRDADDALTDDWSRWFGGVFQWLLEGAIAWL